VTPQQSATDSVSDQRVEPSAESLTDPFADPFASGVKDPFADPFKDSPLPSRASKWRPRGHVPGEVGIWIFIFVDMMAFSNFFLVFMNARSNDVAVFEHSREKLNVTFGAVNTLLLLTGSWFVVLGMRAARRHFDRMSSRWFLAAMLCGLGFVFNKVLEYHDKLSHGYDPSTNDFFMYYFVFTGIHLFHLLLGLCVLLFMWKIARKPILAARDLRNLEAGASYWHLVDLLWIVQIGRAHV